MLDEISMKHLALPGTGKLSAGNKKEGEGVGIGGETSAAHLNVERQTMIMRTMGRVCLDDLVVEEDCWVRNIVEQLVGIWDVWDFKKFFYQELGKIQTVSKGVGM